MDNIDNAERRQAALSPAKQALAQTLLQKWVRGELQTGTQQSQAITATSHDGALPLSYAQERMWFLDQLEPGSSFYNMHEAISLKGRLNVAALEQSLREILRRHESLRTTFSIVEGQPVQIISPAPSWDLQNGLAVTLDKQLLPLPIIDLTRQEQRTTIAKQLAADEAQRPFDLTRGPLLRTTLLRLDEEEHVLLLTMHHIISDGWSVAVLIREVAALYEAFSTVTPSPLPDLPIQYGDYARWQRDPAQLARLAAQLDYWKRQLHEAPPLVDLPTDRPRRSVNSFRGARLDFSFPPRLTAEVRALAQREGASLFMTLLACWQVQLARESGQADIVVGTRTAGRTRAELEGLIGLFVNVLVLRTRVDEGASFRGVLKQVREVALGGFEHQEVSFERLVQELEPARGAALTPLFNLMFVLHKLPIPTQHTTGLVMKPVEVESTTAKYDLDLTLWETPDALSGWLEFNTDLFDRDTVSRLLLRFRRCVAELVRRPLLPIHQLSFLSPEERREAVSDFNRTDADFPSHLPLDELFAAQVARTPDAVAVVDTRQQLTYRELDRRSDQLAHYLQGHYVAPEVPVAVLLDRSAETLITLLAIYKAGGVYVPLDAAAPRTHLEAILRQTCPPVIVTSAAYAERLPPHTAELIRLDTDWQHIAGEGRVRPAPSGVSVDNLAYVMYTSGSTAEPKGVAVEQRQLLNRLHWMWRRYPFAADEVLCQRTTAGFSVSMWEMLGGLLQGCRTVIVEDERAKDLEQLISEMGRQAVTRVVVVPSLLRAMLEVEPGLCAKLSATRMWSVCGEALSAELAESFQAQAGGARLVNQYGASELNDVCFFETGEEYGRLQESEGSKRGKRAGMVPVGEPISNLSVYVLDARMRPVARGQRGEIYVRSISPARGYVGQAGATAERFVPDAVSGVAGGRLYRTGDVGRRVQGGRLEHLGRGDDQVKVRGVRVELKGVEALLRSHEGVAEAVVTARREGGEVTGLVGYVVKAAGGAGVSVRELREYVRERGGEQMAPAVIMEIGEMPLLANGKVNRLALPDPLTVKSEFEETFVSPRTPVEEELARIWIEVLGLERIGVNDRFFDLGGHSLIATRLIARVRDAFAVELPLRSLFHAPTVAGQAIAIAQHKAQKAEAQDTITPLPQITPDLDRRHQPFPLTDIQQAYWIGRSKAFELGNVAAHSYMELDSNGLDLPRFNRALQQVITRHDMLRAIVSSDGQQQILAEVPPYQIQVLNLEGAASQTVEAELEAVRRRMSHQVLPSDRWPLFEIRATRLSEQAHRLHLSFDLLFADAWSWQILGRELIQLYEQPETDFVPLDLSFRDYVLAEAEHQSSEVYRQSLAYWQERLRTLPAAPELPLTQNPASMSRPRFARQQGRLEPDVWARLKAAATGAGLTPSGILLAAFAEVLTAWSKSPRFTLNLTLFNRDALHPQVNQIVGDFTSLNLLTVDNSVREAFEVRARRLQEQLWDDLDHRHASGIRLLRELNRLQGGGQRVSMPVVFTSTLNLAASGRSGAGAGSQLGRVVYSISQTPQVWLDHQVHEQDGALVFNWDAVENLFPEGLLPDMFDAYCRLLHRLSAEAESWREPSPHTLPRAQLEQRVLVNATSARVPKELLHELFASQLPERRRQPAVITAGRTLTYEELSRRSNQLGHRLREMGARPNRLVAIVMEKGWEQVVAALGILQSGAAYLPIDASLPKERLWYLLEHGEVELVVTQSWLDEMLEWPDGIRRIGVEDGDLGGASAQPLEAVQKPSDLAYVIYTSGSTGLPKGVMIDHRGAVNTVLDINARFHMKPADRVFAISSLSFDLSVYDVFGMLAAGGAIVIPDAWAARDPAHWAGLMREHEVTVWNSVPALMKILAEYVAGRGERLATSLRLVMLSGDWLPVGLPDQIKGLAGAAEVVSLGGATEASIWSILYPIGVVDPKWQSIPYGRPMLNQQFHVLDEAFEPRPVWVPGQLYIGGVGLAKGYWRDELKSNASFFTHPRTREPLYRTGDLGRYLPDGNIEFLGREDFQVKIQGYRIELGEIEAALLEHPSVSAGVVAVMGEPRGNKRLVAYIVAHNGDAPTTSELRRFLKDKLPDYMVPAVYTTLDALPLTSNGKVDRKALPDMAKPHGHGRTGGQVELPASAARIGELLREFLKIEEIEPGMSLLDLGASSVDMIRIANLLEKELGFRPQIDEFYREPTLLGLANAYERSSPGEASDDSVAPAVESATMDSIIASFPIYKDPEERAEFKRRQTNLRRIVNEEANVELPETETEKSLGGMLEARRTHRQFLRRPVALKHLAGLMNCLRAVTLNGQSKYLYPSAGGIYPVQSYLHVKPGAVEGLGAGTYYYDPVGHRLVSLVPGAEIPARAHDAFINRPIFADAGFSIFLVGQLSAIAPIYGRHSGPFVTLEAGYMGQLLMMLAPAHHIGLCPVGIMDFESVRHLFALDESHVLVHSLLGGAIDRGTDHSWSALQEDYQSGTMEVEREEVEL